MRQAWRRSWGPLPSCTSFQQSPVIAPKLFSKTQSMCWASRRGEWRTCVCLNRLRRREKGPGLPWLPLLLLLPFPCPGRRRQGASPLPPPCWPIYTLGCMSSKKGKEASSSQGKTTRLLDNIRNVPVAVQQPYEATCNVRYEFQWRRRELRLPCAWHLSGSLFPRSSQTPFHHFVLRRPSSCPVALDHMGSAYAVQRTWVSCLDPSSPL